MTVAVSASTPRADVDGAARHFCCAPAGPRTSRSRPLPPPEAAARLGARDRGRRPAARRRRAGRARSTGSTTWPTRAWPPRCSWPYACRSRCCSRASRGSARPRSRRRWPGCWTPRSSGCSATRGSTAPRRSTSGTTPGRCWRSGSRSRRDRPLDTGALFSPEYLLRRPLLAALEHPGPRPAVLLIDELDRADDDFEAFTLELLAEGDGDHPGARHGPADAPADRRPHLQPHPRPARRAATALPVPLDRLPAAGPRRRDRAAAGAGQRRAAGADDRRGGRPAALARAGEGRPASPRPSTGSRRST